MDAFFRRLDQTLPRPAFGTDLAGKHPRPEPAVDALKSLVPAVMTLQVDACLMLGVAFRFRGEERADRAGGALRPLAVGPDRPHQRSLRERTLREIQHGRQLIL